MTLRHVLDHLALGRTQEAADICAQRLKSVQLASKHGNWDRSRFIELVPMADSDLADPSEKKVANRGLKDNKELEGTSSSGKPWVESGKRKGGGKKQKNEDDGKGFYNWVPYGRKGNGNGKKAKGGGKKYKGEQKVDKDGNHMES